MTAKYWHRHGETPETVATGRVPNADPRIADLHFNLYFGVTERPLFYQNVDIATLGELNGITHQISNDLLQAQRVANHIIRDVVFNI